jgi:hypothetical protein
VQTSLAAVHLQASGWPKTGFGMEAFVTWKSLRLVYNVQKNGNDAAVWRGDRPRFPHPSRMTWSVRDGLIFRRPGSGYINGYASGNVSGYANGYGKAAECQPWDEPGGFCPTPRQVSSQQFLKSIVQRDVTASRAA